MNIANIDIISPYLFPHEPFNETETLGALLWLWSNSPKYCQAPLQDAMAYILPILKNGQFALFSRNHYPIGYFSWAFFNEQTEKQYLQSDNILFNELHWNTGSKMWFIHWFAPFGDSRIMKNALSQLFPNQKAYSLYHRGNETGKRIMRFHLK